MSRRATVSSVARRLFSDYGMLAVLLLLGLGFAVATWRPESADGAAGGTALAHELAGRPGAGVAIVTQGLPEDAAFAAAVRLGLAHTTVNVVAEVQGDPPQVRQALESVVRAGRPFQIVATTPACAGWPVFAALRQQSPQLAGLEVRAPSTARRSAFLAPSNLRNVADQIAVIAICAVGMTLVIITAGIDLSVGSLIALSAVVTAWLIRAFGGAGASGLHLLLASLGAIALCGGVGTFSGLMITGFRIPPFIATLAMMQVASGLAFIIAKGQSIYDIPDSFCWLGRGAGLLGLPNAVVVMLVVFVAAHCFMTGTVLGRQLYAIGGNPEAARLSGVRSQRAIVFAYLVCGLSAGLGGVITASQLRAGAPTYGAMYELYVIAAVVVGGTSLAGGEGGIFGTLIGALIIAVIRNGMNLVGVEPYTQKIVLGLVILGAVLLDMLKRRRTG